MRKIIERVENIALNSVVKIKRWITNMKNKYIYTEI